MTVSRFGYQVSFHLQFQKTRVPKSVTIFPDQSWIHMPATLRRKFIITFCRKLHLDPMGPGIVEPHKHCVCATLNPKDGPATWKMETNIIFKNNAHPLYTHSGSSGCPGFKVWCIRQDHNHKSIFSNLNYFKKGWFCQDIKGASVAHWSLNTKPELSFSGLIVGLTGKYLGTVWCQYIVFLSSTLKSSSW